MEPTHDMPSASGKNRQDSLNKYKKDSETERHRNGSEERLNKIFEAHERACQRVDVAIASLKEAVLSVVALDHIIGSIEPNSDLRLKRRLKIPILLQDVGMAYHKVSKIVKISRVAASIHKELVYDLLKIRESNFD